MLAKRHYLWTCCAFGLLVFAMTLPVGAQSGDESREPLRITPTFFLPVEIGDGAIFVDRKPQVYTASLRIHPTVGIGSERKLRIGATGALQYFSPDLELMGGVRISYQFLDAFNIGGASAGLHLAAEGLVGTNNRKTAGGALIGDGFGAVQFTARIARELEADFWLFELSVGTDLAFWFRGPAKRPETQRPILYPDLEGYFRMIAVRMAREASWLLDEDSQEQLHKAKAVIDDAARLPNVDALKDFLQNQTLFRLTQTVQRTINGANRRAEIENVPIPDLNEADNQRDLVNALIQGWRKSMEN